MDIQHILCALEVHDCGSISKAANNLFMSQPNLSVAIKDLEKELGITLFIRQNHGVITTEEGIEFFQYARSIATRYDAMEKRYLLNKNKNAISITSVRSSVIMKKVSEFINERINKNEEFDISFKETTNDQVIEDVITNKANIGILRANRDNFNNYSKIMEAQQLFMLPLPKDCYVLLMSKKHPLASETIYSIAQLAPYPEIVYGDFETSWYPQMSKIYARNPNEPLQIIRLFDRASFFDTITHVYGAYAMTTTSSHEMLAKYDLIEKSYPGNILESREAIIVKNSSLHDPKISTLMSLFSVSI